MKLTANTRFTPGADIRIPLNAIVPADVTLTQSTRAATRWPVAVHAVCT